MEEILLRERRSSGRCARFRSLSPRGTKRSVLQADDRRDQKLQPVNSWRSPAKSSWSMTARRTRRRTSRSNTGRGWCASSTGKLPRPAMRVPIRPTEICCSSWMRIHSSLNQSCKPPWNPSSAARWAVAVVFGSMGEFRCMPRVLEAIGGQAPTGFVGIAAGCASCFAHARRSGPGERIQPLPALRRGRGRDEPRVARRQGRICDSAGERDHVGPETSDVLGLGNLYADHANRAPRTSLPPESPRHGNLVR